MSRHDIGPIERYPASPERIEARAGELGRLAGQALAEERVTGRTFAPATAHWEGVGAAELLTAPLPLQRWARAASEALMWAALALRLWASRVRDFNQRVADIKTRWPAPEHWGRLFGPPFGPPLTPSYPMHWFVLQERRDRLAQEWQEAHRTLIDLGEDETVAMLREGPTLAHLRRVRHAGLVPATGVWGFFGARWDEQVAPELAAELAGRLAAPGYVPTPQEAEQLAGLLERYAGDPAFAAFLSELAPAELYRLLANLAGMTAATPQVWRPLLATIQERLGVALATATRPGRYQLSESWLASLAAAGRDLVGIVPQVPLVPQLRPGRPGTVDVYGYQLLGPLLHHGRYHERFLEVVGGDLVDVELAQGGSHVWMAHHPDLWGPHALGDAYAGYRGPIAEIRLDWVHGWQRGGPHGFDPVVGLASALERNPDGARALLTGATTDEAPTYADPPPDGVRLPRLDYLLTDREWPTDLVDVEVELTGFERPVIESYPNPGVESLGRALVDAVTEDPDDRSHQIAASMIYEIAHDEQRSGYPNDPTGQGLRHGDQTATFREVDLVPPPLRPHLGEIAATYIDDIHWSFTSPAERDSDLPGAHHISPTEPDLQVFLAELGKDPQARDRIAVAETVYAGLVYDHYLSGAATQDEFGDRLDAGYGGATIPAASVFGALDFGAASEVASSQAEADQAYNRALRDRYFLAELVTDTVTGGVTAGTGGAAAAVIEPLNAIINQALAESLDDRLADHTGVTNQAIGDLRHLSRDLLRQQLEAAAYRHTSHEDLERLGLLYQEGHPQAGQPVLRSEWDDAQAAAWGRFVTGPEAHHILPVIGQARLDYNAAYDGVQQDLASHTG